MKIRKARISDIEKIMKFIESQWKIDHILSKKKSFMDWQHKSDCGYNFVIAVEGGIILAILGYIDNKKYDANCRIKTIWLALWKVNDNLKNSGLGLKLIKFLELLEQPDILACNGVLISHQPIYSLLKFKLFSLKCFYIVNSLVPNKIIEIPNDKFKKNNSDKLSPHLSKLSLQKPEDLKALNWDTHDKLNEIVKTPNYFCERYLEHPVYNYRVYKITGANHSVSLIATRIIRHNNSKVLRIIDFSGDNNSLIGLARLIKEIIEIEGIEYCDFWQHGIKDSILVDSGFTLLEGNSDVIIPNFFEPFVKKTGEIHSVLKTKLCSNYIICKGDGDQDRPSQIYEKI